MKNMQEINRPIPTFISFKKKNLLASVQITEEVMHEAAPKREWKKVPLKKFPNNGSADIKVFFFFFEDRKE